MNEGATNYPLTWPLGIKRTHSDDRRRAQFGRVQQKAGQTWARKQELTVADGMRRIYEQLEKLEPRITSLVVSTNIQVKLDGTPRSGLRDPDDPGVCLYFNLDRKPHAMPCDKWDRVADNLAAIAKHIEAIRMMEQWGVGDLAQMFTGFAALPQRTRSHEILGISENATLEEAARARNALALTNHPDRGGSTDRMAEINAAYDEFKRSRE